jgi:hypothetical protein
MKGEQLSRNIMIDPTMDLKKLQEQTVAEIKAGKSLPGQGGLLTSLIKGDLEASLESEIEAHLESTPEGANRRNGKLRKTVKHSWCL